MHNIWLVAQQAFVSNIRSRSFLFTAFGIPALIGVALVAVGALTAGSINEDADEETLGYVDQAQIVLDESLVPEAFNAYADEAAARAALEAGEIDAYVVIPDTYLRRGRVSYYATSTVSEAHEDAIDELLVASLLSGVETNLPPERLQEPIVMSLFLENNQREISNEAFVGSVFTPLIFAFVFFFALQISATLLMSSIVEEKSNRIMEVLITSITPYQLLTGKLIGAGALGLLQVAVWIGVALFVQATTRNVEALAGIFIPVDLILLAVVYFLLAFMLYGSLLAGVGAVVSTEQESRQIASVISLIALIPFFAVTMFFDSPDSPLVAFFTVFPFTSPISVIFRTALDTVPLWQVVLSIVLMISTSLLVMWLSARVFRWASLLYGKRITLRNVWQVVMGGAEIGVMPGKKEATS